LLPSKGVQALNLGKDGFSLLELVLGLHTVLLGLPIRRKCRPVRFPCSQEEKVSAPLIQPHLRVEPAGRCVWTTRVRGV
jgi:hypothetical protein